LEGQLLNNWEQKININTKFDKLEKKLNQLENIDVLNNLHYNNNIDQNKE
jgi:hypothetical protein